MDIFLTAKFMRNVRIIANMGCDAQYLAVFEAWANQTDMSDHYLTRTGNSRDCVVGRWGSEAKLAEARTVMIEHLNSIRELLEELTAELTQQILFRSCYSRQNQDYT